VLWAEARIRRVLLDYVRGIDRLDLDRVRTCYHPDATDTHGSFAGTVDEFCVWVERVLRRYDSTMHLLGPPAVDVVASDPDGTPTAAAVETYGLAFHRTAGGPPEHNLVTGFRFVDRFECRAGAWRIARRTAVTEWSQVVDEAAWWPLPAGLLVGTRDRTDPVYRDAATD
jgi:hypothetical protein